MDARRVKFAGVLGCIGRVRYKTIDTGNTAK